MMKRASNPPRIADSALVGQDLGRYRLLEQVGRGGMGVVYRAHQPPLEREVAVKVIAGHLANDEMFRLRFDEEAHAGSQLVHPHILPIFDVGEERGLSYLVMPYMSGGKLTARIARNLRGMPLDDVLRIVNQIGSALTYLHDRGIVHRDIKPANILFDSDENAYLSDFGIAARIAEQASGVPTGTRQYRAPEMSAGAPATPVSDVFSLGVITYQMLTGQRPDLTTPEIGRRDPSQVRESLPRGVGLIVEQALSFDPQARPPNAVAFARALEHAIQNASVDTETVESTTTPKISDPAFVDRDSVPVDLEDIMKNLDVEPDTDPEFDQTGEMPSIHRAVDMDEVYDRIDGGYQDIPHVRQPDSGTMDEIYGQLSGLETAPATGPYSGSDLDVPHLIKGTDVTDEGDTPPPPPGTMPESWEALRVSFDDDEEEGDTPPPESVPVSRLPAFQGVGPLPEEVTGVLPDAPPVPEHHTPPWLPSEFEPITDEADSHSPPFSALPVGLPDITGVSERLVGSSPVSRSGSASPVIEQGEPTAMTALTRIRSVRQFTTRREQIVHRIVIGLLIVSLIAAFIFTMLSLGYSPTS